jgi:hypothetical protein
VRPPTNVGRIPEGGLGIKHHRRFILRDVSLGGLPVGNATIDAWRDASGAEHWSARLLVPSAQPLREGVLAGTVAGGQRLRGGVHLGGTAAGPRRGREVLVEFHGDGRLAHEEPPNLERRTIPTDVRL